MWIFTRATRDPRTAWSLHRSVRVGAIFFGFNLSWCGAVWGPTGSDAWIPESNNDQSYRKCTEKSKMLRNLKKSIKHIFQIKTLCCQNWNSWSLVLLTTFAGYETDENLCKHRFIRNLGKNYSPIMLTDIQVKLRITTD